ncbi:MAG: sigma 54-interacting transcriptional regulator [Proteobacteria bacterium]|nr:sigma 54-interacting transcriptional regulator [Pseudomonadota bacterium]
MEQTIAIICSGKIKSLEEIDLSGVTIFEEVKMSEAGKLAAKLESSGVGAIIATAGNAPEVRKQVSVPVIVAELTYFDVLETLKEIESTPRGFEKKIALILHETNSFNMGRLQPFLKNHISFFVFKNEEHLYKIIQLLFEKDFEMLVGGPTSLFYAKQLGMNAHQIAFGKETIAEALNRVNEVFSLIRKDREEKQRLKTVIDMFPDGIIATNHNGEVTMCNPRALNLLNLPEQDVLGKKVYRIADDPTWKEVYEQGIKQTDVLIEYNKSKLFSTRQPIIENGHIIGSVGTLQDVAKIQKLEHKYRSTQTLGLIAKYRFENVIGNSTVIKEAIEQAKAYAEFDSTILIEGETGTGKEIFAQSIHNASLRKSGPLVAINCATLSESLLESELFGYEEGAFTGAKRGGKVGLFELAHKGTIFLDEINQIPLQLQAKVLRVIQEKVVLRLGGEKVIPVDVRIIVATNENLKEKINAGKFRDDLYYRINVLNLRLPPLRRRKEDIPLLVDHFFQLFVSTHGTVKCAVGEFIDFVSKYDWPGNVRELANYVERYAVLSQKTKAAHSLLFQEFGMENAERAKISPDVTSITLKIDDLGNMEKQIIKHVVAQCGGNKQQAALLLGVSRSSVWYKIRKGDQLLK